MTLVVRPDELSVPEKRIRLDQFDGSVVSVAGEVFSGIGYIPDEEESTFRAMRFVDGVPQSVVDDPVLPDVPIVSALHPDYRSPENLSGGTFFGETFTGLEVRFNKNGSVWQARIIEEGRRVNWYKFDKSGVVIEHIVNARPADDTKELPAFQQSVRWSASGASIGSATAFWCGETTPAGNFGVDSEHRLSSVRFLSGYFDAIERWKNLLIYPGLQDFDFLAEFTPAVGAFWLGLDDRADELVDQLLQHGSLEQVQLLHVENLSATGLAALRKLVDVGLPALGGLFTEPMPSIHYPLIPFLCELKRRRGIGVSIHNLVFKTISALSDRDELSSHRSVAYFDNELNELIGIENLQFRSDGLLEFALKAPSLRFLRYQREAEGRQFERLLNERSDVVAYGPDVSNDQWLSLVSLQLRNEGLISDS